MRRRKPRRRWIAIALAAMLVGAPTAQARIDEDAGNTAPAEPAPVRVADSDGFSWGDAGIGAGAALGAVVVAAGAGLGLRKRSVPAHW
jgi:hypothetical protein